MRRLREHLGALVLVGGSGLVLAALAVLIVVAVRHDMHAEAAFRDRCRATGGTVTAHDGYKDTALFCVSADGRILEIL